LGLVVVAFDIVEGRRVGGPDDRAVGRRDRFCVLVAGADRPDADVVILGAEPVDAVRNQLVVRAVAYLGDAKELFSRTLEVAVVEDRLGASVARRTHVDGVFAAFAEADGIGELAVDRGHRAVVLLDAAAHFRGQLLAECFEVVRGVIVVAVLGFEMRTNVRVQRARVAQDLLPVAVA
jgi:hypothetical protein